MKLTPYGLLVRTLRLELGLTLKSMADSMGVTPAYLSSIELGDRTLTQKLADDVMAYFRPRVSAERLAELRSTIDRSAQAVPVAQLGSEEKGLVAAFARRLGNGDNIPDEIKNWLTNGGIYGRDR